MNQELQGFLKSTFTNSDQNYPYSKTTLRSFLNLFPVSHFIPPEMGGQFTCAESYLTVVEETSYYSVPLGLTLGIVGSLFVQPVARFACPPLRDRLIPMFLNEAQLGGMMITEPAGGTDIFNLNTSYTKTPSGLLIEGVKCWAGLTGQAQHWLVAAREKKGNRLTKRVSFIYVPQHHPGVRVNKYFHALGLSPIHYGETSFSTTVPQHHLLEDSNFGNTRIIYDTLLRSRMGIPAIAAGLCRRLTRELHERTTHRNVFGKPLKHYDQVQARLAAVRGRQHICQSLWRFTAKWMNDHNDVTNDSTLVNASKTIASEVMQTASDSALQLFAAAGFKKTHVIGQAFINARPFQVFEGTNDVLYENIVDVFAKQYGTIDLTSLATELNKYHLRLSDSFPISWISTLHHVGKLSQREKVHGGKLLAWAIVLGILLAENEPPIPNFTDALRVALSVIHSLVAQIPFLHNADQL